MALRLLRMLPASLAVPSAFLNRGGGAKSRPVKVPDLRNACLWFQLERFHHTVISMELTGLA